MSSPRFITALPVFNEVQYVNEVLDLVKQYSADILVVDDGSTDGTTEQLQRRDDVRIVTAAFEENDRARTEHRTDGMVKAVVGPKGRILGAGIVGYHAGELIQPWILAISQKLKIGAMAQMIAPYPTLGEINKRAAGAYYTPSLFSNRTRKIVRLLAKLG